MNIVIVKAERRVNASDSSEFTNVEYKVLDGEEVVFHGNEGFPLLTPAEDIEALLEAKLAAIHADAEQAAKNKPLDEARKENDATLAKLNGASN